MREILFRGFHADENGSQKIKMDGKVIKGTWIEGDLMQNFDERAFIGEIVFEGINETLGINGFGVYEVIPSTVSQYTGLTDKHSIKIFENDRFIPRYNGLSENVVVYEKGKFNISFFNVQQCEILGTIFDVEVQNGEI